MSASVCCAVTVCCSVRCCCGCGSGVVVGAERWSRCCLLAPPFLPRVVSREVAAVGETTATQSVGEP